MDDEIKDNGHCSLKKTLLLMIIILSFQKSKFYLYFVDGFYVDDHEI
jgi:hypothetical protein